MTSRAARGSSSLQSRLEHVPGVERVAFTSMRPKSGFQTYRLLSDVDTLAHKKPFGFVTAVSPGFFDADRDSAPPRARLCARLERVSRHR